MTPGVQMISVVLVLLFGGISAGHCNTIQKMRVAQAASVRQTTAAVATLETCVKGKQALIDKHDVEEAQREKERDEAFAVIDGEPDPIQVSIGNVYCRLEADDWFREAEHKARVPHRTFQAFYESFEGNGPVPKLTRAQKRRLSRVIKDYPLPECIGKSGAENVQAMRDKVAASKEKGGG